jgi:hypothetical protein
MGLRPARRLLWWRRLRCFGRTILRESSIMCGAKIWTVRGLLNLRRGMDWIRVWISGKSEISSGFWWIVDAVGVWLSVIRVFFQDWESQCAAWPQANVKGLPSVPMALQMLLRLQLARIAASSPQRRDAVPFCTAVWLKYLGGQLNSYPCARTTAKSR